MSAPGSLRVTTANPPDVRRLRGALEAIDDDSYLAQAAVSDVGSVQEFVGGPAQRFGGVDIVINNAGIVSQKMLEISSSTSGTA
jgi:NAD(P)-dependent dehydrogenase (short-subunit alcohol dehydrogenase family)